MLSFLTDLFEAGLGYSAINTARSALSSVILMSDKSTIGTHPLVVRFLKGVFELRTPMPRHSKIWDVGDVLKYFKTLPDNAQLSLKDITLKVSALLLLASAQRVQTLHLMNLESVCFLENKCVIYMTEKLKHTRPGYHQQNLDLPVYTVDEQVCVVKCLKEYIERTKKLRVDQSGKLLLCYKPPHEPASRDTISRWLRTVLARAGLSSYTPHSFRCAASSAMKRSGVPLGDILKAAGWTNAKTFKQFYDKPLQSQMKKNTILNYYGKKSV